MNAKKIIASSLFLVSVAAISVPGLALTSGPVWSHGCNNNPSNWGAFSNYYHPSRSHWSSVVRHSDSMSNRGTAGAGGTSKAFINTKVGEVVDFDYGD